MPRSFVLLFAVAALFVGLALTAPPVSGNDTATRWEYFSESSGCDGSYTRPPFATRSGVLPNSEPILGPFGTYFGRSVLESRAQQVTWAVPFSGGRQVKVHRDALPAFQQVAATLAAHAAQGRVYQINSVGAFYPRTVGGEHQISRHTFGTAIDINPAQNPYRRNGPLITDMPGWFVDAWRDAGFCWGGDWRGEKDAMHFSWIGPGTGVGNAMNPRPPLTQVEDYGPVDRTFTTAMAPVLGRYEIAIGAATGNGGPSVAGIRSHPDGAVIDVASGTGGFGSCSVFRWFVADSGIAAVDHLLLMDVDGDSRSDLVTLDGTGGSSEVRIATYAGRFEDVTSFTRSFGDVVAIAGADFDSDHVADLWVATADGMLDIYEGPDFVDRLSRNALPSGAPQLISAADRDGGNRPELFALYPDGLQVLRLGQNWSVEQRLPVGDTLALGAMDYDGDGRADVLNLDSQGRLHARIGNTPTGASTTGWFMSPRSDCQNAIPLTYSGTFYDDDGNVHTNGIEWIAAERITVGCNPPFNDAFCPDDLLTRAEAATFVVRAIGLPAPEEDYFIDDNGHVLEGGINRLAAAKITAGCNPPANNRFCPDRDMTRAEFGTFLARALGLPPTTKDFFIDDNGHVLEGAINRLAAAGITSGCNPPANDEFCPNRKLTRAEAATFLTRAFK